MHLQLHSSLTLTPHYRSQAMLKYDPETRQVQLAVDRAYQPGEPVLAWCGPQVRSRGVGEIL